METTQGIICDLDDTLCNSSDCYKLAYEVMYDWVAQELSLPREQIIDAVHIAKRETHERLDGQACMHARVLYLHGAFEKLLGKSDLLLAKKAADVFNLEVISHLTLFPGTEEFLEALVSRGIQICLTTNQRTDIQAQKIEKLAIAKYFSRVVTSEEAGREKPDSSIFSQAFEKLGLGSESCAAIGDNWKADIIGGQQVGIKRLLYKGSDARSSEILPDVEFIQFHTYQELTPLLATWF